jgi:hypothetical protein
MFAVRAMLAAARFSPAHRDVAARRDCGYPLSAFPGCTDAFHEVARDHERQMLGRTALPLPGALPTRSAQLTHEATRGTPS